MKVKLSLIINTVRKFGFLLNYLLKIPKIIRQESNLEAKNSYFRNKWN